MGLVEVEEEEREEREWQLLAWLEILVNLEMDEGILKNGLDSKLIDNLNYLVGW